PYVSDEHKKEAHSIAESYFDLACSYTNSTPALFITSGLSGCGKSTVAHELAKRLGLVVLSSDVTRKKLAHISTKEHRFDSIESGIYSPEFSRKTYDALFSEAEKVLKDGASVIIDATFIKSAERITAKKLAEQTGAKFYIIECKLDEETTHSRLEKRMNEHTPSDGRWEIYLAQKNSIEPVSEIPASNHIIIDTEKSTEDNVNILLDRLGYI
ncbi:MAG: AAA family ATPase, partial [Dehalococcoidales bacterium]